MRVRSTTRRPSRGSIAEWYGRSPAALESCKGSADAGPQRPALRVPWDGQRGDRILRRDVAFPHHHVAVLREIRELPSVAAALLQVEGHAGVDGPAVDVERDRRLASLHHHLVDGLDLVH